MSATLWGALLAGCGTLRDGVQARGHSGFDIVSYRITCSQPWVIMAPKGLFGH